jgi:hypothetical protein
LLAGGFLEAYLIELIDPSMLQWLSLDILYDTSKII